MKKSFVLCALAICGLLSSCDEYVSENKVLVLLPSSKTTSRWELDAQYLKEALESGGAVANVKVADTDTMQLEQLKAGLQSGYQNIIITPVDYNFINRSNVLDGMDYLNIVCHDRILYNNPVVDFYSNCDSYHVGELQGQFLVQQYLASGKTSMTLELFAGPSSDYNALLIFEGAMSRLKPYIANRSLVVKSGKTQYKQVKLDSWGKEAAHKASQERFKTEVPELILAASDNIAKGCIATIDESSATLEQYPVITGMDASDDAVKLVDSGKMSMTINKSILEMANNTANVILLMMNEVKPATSVSFTDSLMSVPAINSVPSIILKSEK